MSDISLRFSAVELMLMAYLIVGPVLMALALGLRAITHRGRMRGIALAGLGLLAAAVADLLLDRAGAGLAGPAGRGLALGAAAIAWAATAAMARNRRWVDAAVLVLPALSGAALIWLEG
ncbi:MAG: hypothetical protein RQ752_11220 [Thermohalobaculum sp.]|nr:hypothetical protein [Thermohalobaculum sp.]